MDLIDNPYRLGWWRWYCGENARHFTNAIWKSERQTCAIILFLLLTLNTTVNFISCRNGPGNSPWFLQCWNSNIIGDNKIMSTRVTYYKEKELIFSYVIVRGAGLSIIDPFILSGCSSYLVSFVHNESHHNSAISWAIEMKLFVVNLQCSRVQLIVYCTFLTFSTLYFSINFSVIYTIIVTDSDRDRLTLTIRSEVTKFLDGGLVWEG